MIKPLSIELKARSELVLQQINELSAKLTNQPELYQSSRVMYFALQGIVNKVSDLVIAASESEKCKEKAEAELVALQKNSLADRIERHTTLARLSSIDAEHQTALYRINALQDQLASSEEERLGQVQRHKDHLKDQKEAAAKQLEITKQKAESKDKQRSETIAKLQLTITNLQREVGEANRELQKTNGVAVNNGTFTGKTKGVRFYIHEYSSPLSIRFSKLNGIGLLEGETNWHYQVMRENGVSINVGPTCWLTPVLPETVEFKDHWNMKISDRLHELMLDRAKGSHPVEYALTMKAKKLPITNHPGLSSEQSEALKKAKLITLFDSVSLTTTAFVNQIKKHNKQVDDSFCLDLKATINGQIEKEFRSAQLSSVQKAA